MRDRPQLDYGGPRLIVLGPLAQHIGSALFAESTDSLAQHAAFALCQLLGVLPCEPEAAPVAVGSFQRIVGRLAQLVEAQFTAHGAPMPGVSCRTFLLCG